MSYLELALDVLKSNDAVTANQEHKDTFSLDVPKAITTDETQFPYLYEKNELNEKSHRSPDQAVTAATALVNEPHRRLYPFLGKVVQTPKGPGKLWQVFSFRIGVILDADSNHVSFFLPEQIQIKRSQTI